MTAVLKWIRCEVVDRDGFDRAQRRWSALGGVDGFEWQCGGWEPAADGIAHVLARWRDAAAHTAFLTGVHDELAGEQHVTYSAIEVAVGRIERDGPWPIHLADIDWTIDVTLAPTSTDPRDDSGRLVATFEHPDGVGTVTFDLVPPGADATRARPTRSIDVEPSWTVLAGR